ncbi:MAG: hypothetical protein WBF49_13480 [Methyloceanibacter sp.]|jgi:hypothetical protein
MALSRFEGRRDAVLQEANAICTTALRARLLPEPHNTETLKLLREYVQIRLDITQRVPSPPRSSMLRLPTPTKFNSSFGNRQWRWPRRIAGSCPPASVIQSLNELIDDQEKRLTAVRDRVPNIVILLLYGVAMVAGAFPAMPADWGYDPRGCRRT